MRTTLDIEDDVLAAAKELARRENTTTGRLISKLLRRSLTGEGGAAAGGTTPRANKAGFRPLPPRGVVVSNEVVNRLRDQEGV